MRPIFFILYITLIASSCSTIAPGIAKHQALPSSYDDKQFDTTSIAQKSWREFFTDKQLQDLIDTALRNNTDMNLAIKQIEIAYTQLKINQRAMLPSLLLHGDVNHLSMGSASVNAPINATGTSTQNSYYAGLSSTWELDVWGKLNAAKQAQRMRFLASKQSLRMVQTALVAEIAHAWYELLAIDEDLRILQKNIELQTAALEIVKVQQDAGKATALAVQQFEAQLQFTQSEVFHLQRHQNQYEQIINNLAGRNQQPIERHAKLMNQALPSDIKLGIPAQLLTNRPDVIEASLRLHAAGFDVKAAQRACYPQISITPSIGFSAVEPSLLFTPQTMVYSLAGSLLAPVFQQYRLRGAKRIKQIEQEQAMLYYQQTIRRAINEIQYTQKNMQLYANEFTIASQRTATLLSAIATANELYLYGYASYLEVVNAQKYALEAELNLVEIQKAQQQLHISLYRALGGGME